MLATGPRNLHGRSCYFSSSLLCNSHIIATVVPKEVGVILAGLLLSVVLGAGPSLFTTDSPSVVDRQATRAATVASQEMQVVDGIEATSAVHAVLDKIRTALGGKQKLAAVTSLVIEGSYGNGQTQFEQSFTYRIAPPDRFRWNNGGSIIILDGPSRYLQIPDVSDTVKARARKNATKEFTLQSLTLLLRAPSTIKVRASLLKAEQAGAVTVAFTTTAGFAVLLEVDPASFTPNGFSYVGNLEEGVCGEPPTVSAATRRVTFDEFRDVDGIRFPRKMSDSISTAGDTTMLWRQFTSITVNTPLTAADFEK